MKIFTFVAITVFGLSGVALAKTEAATSPKSAAMETDDIFADIHPEDLGDPEQMSEDLRSAILVQRETEVVLQIAAMENFAFVELMRAMYETHRKAVLAAQAAAKK